ncbi:MAG: InlB B-repeat-containing protein [Ruminococcus sp.]|nr:InlB B-repeat-containing protein [Ruminococcus sp.]
MRNYTFSEDGSVLTGSSAVDAYSLTLNVKVEDGKIADIAVAEGSTGTWDSVLANAKQTHVGKTVDDSKAAAVDAVSSATKYSAAFYTALGNALSTEQSSETTAPASTSQSSSSEPTATTASGIIADGTYTYTADVKGYYKTPATIPATVTVVVSGGKFTSFSVSTESRYSKDQYQIEGNFNTLKNALTGKDAASANIEAVAYSSNVSPNYPDQTTFNDLKAALISAVSASVAPAVTTTEPAPTTTTTTTVAAPVHVKSISESDNGHTIKLNVIGRDLTVSSSTTIPGETVEKGTDLVMVIDISGSIVGKEAALNSAIQSLVQGLPESSQVGIVTFNESAYMSKVYNKDTISGLSFSGVENAGTQMSTGINAAYSLLSSGQWSNTGNNKAMVVISDLDADDYSESINAAKTAKAAGVKIYSVKIDSASVPSPSATELSSDDRSTSSLALAHYISSHYPSASAVNNSMFGMFNQASVAPGTADSSAAYVYGAAGGNWGDVFAAIKETQNITETTETSVETEVTEIYDILTEYVQLSNTSAGENYGVTVTNDGKAVTDVTVSYDSTLRRITVTFDPPIAVKDGKELAVGIPVEPTEAAQNAENEAGSLTSTFKTNQGAALTYRYGDRSAVSAYAEAPTITLQKHSTFTLTYDGDGGTPVPAKQTAEVVGGYSAELTVSDTVPAKTGFKFDHWYEENDDNAAEYAPGSSITNYGDVTLKAHWTADAFTVKWVDEDGTVLETDENVPYGTVPSYDGNEPEKEADAQYEYVFAGWDGEIAAVTGDATYTAVYNSSIRSYTVRFLDDDGTVLETLSVPYGETPSYSGEAPTKSGDAQHSYTFAGWTPSAAPVTGDTDYTALYTEGTNSYTVRFLDWDDTDLKSESLAYGSVPAAPADPVRSEEIDGSGVKHIYTFTGWDPEPGTVTGDAVYKAAYSEKLLYRIFIDDYTKGRAEVTGIVSGKYYEPGDVSFTVSADQAVVFGISNCDDTYTRLFCTDNGDGTYTFTVTVESSDVYLVEGFKGDVDLNGSVNSKDSAQIAKYVSETFDISSELKLFIGDIDANGRINSKDSAMIAKFVSETYSPAWDIA